MANATKSSAQRSRRKGAALPPIEIYTDQRVAEFLLNNSVDAGDYTRAIKLVRKMGLNPAKIDHWKPAGVK